MEIRKIKKALNKHGIIAFPTETVMGLGVFYDDFEAYEKLNKVKQRREDKPYTMMLSKVEDIFKYAEVDNRYLNLIKKYMPGSLTILVKSKPNVPSYVTHGTGTIGIRIPSNKEALELLEYVKKPLLVPSANRRDEKPALTSQEVKDIFQDEIKVVVPGETCKGQPSTIIDLTGDEIKLIRKGPISLEELNLALN
jgi:L-threonylcarbamoyladenylate synthase